MKTLAQMVVIAVGCAIVCSGSGCGEGDQSKPQSTSNTSAQTSASSSPTADVPAKPSVPSAPAAGPWRVNHELVYGLPWPSEKQSESELQAAVKEAEPTPDQRVVLALNDLAGWYRGKKNYTEAEKLYKRVLDLQSSRMGAEHHDVALTHNDLGVLYTEADRSADAEAAFKKALDIWKKSWDQEIRTEDEAVTHHNYAALLEKTGRTSEAKAMEEKATAMMAARNKAFSF